MAIGWAGELAERAAVDPLDVIPRQHIEPSSFRHRTPAECGISSLQLCTPLARDHENRTGMQGLRIFFGANTQKAGPRGRRKSMYRIHCRY